MSPVVLSVGKVNATLAISVEITNTGSMAGMEVVQASGPYRRRWRGAAEGWVSMAGVLLLLP
jgi:hypothetical protein